MRMTLSQVMLCATLSAGMLAGQEPVFSSEQIFPLDRLHNHSSAIVEQPNGDLFVCWFHGSGERQADDVIVQAARWSKAKKAWSAPFTLADTPGFPDANPTLFIDSKQRLWFAWAVILANEWHTALVKYRVSSDYQQAEGPPRWERADNLILIPKNMAARTKEVLERDLRRPGPFAQRAAGLIALAADKYFSRLGWFGRTHPIELPSGRILVPLYSDGYSFSLMGISDDGGMTWTASEPIVGYGGIQPSVVRRKDGTLVAYMRDNGPPPKRAHMSTSRDEGMTWSAAEDSDIPNPGSSLEAIALRDGTWLMVHNDTESGRHSLAAALSDDEGKTWKWKRHIELEPAGRTAASFHYPSVMQARDGSVHVTYSYFQNNVPEGTPRKSIKHARFNTEWVKRGD